MTTLGRDNPAVRVDEARVLALINANTVDEARVLELISENSSSSGEQVAYAEIHSIITISGTAQGTPTDTGLAVTFTADGSTRYCVEFYAPFFRNAGDSLTFVDLWLDGAALNHFVLVGGAQSPNEYTPGGLNRQYITPAAGSHTLAIKGFRSASGGDGEVGAGTGTGGDYAPAYLRVITA